MSIGRSKEEQELTALLAATLVRKEVLEPMSKIGWGHGSPPPPDYSGQPTPTEGAPTPAQTPALAPGQAGQPTPTPGVQPQPVAPVKADAPTQPQDVVALFESLRDPKNGLIMGKYPDVAAALKGAGHLANMAKQAFTERDQALTQLSTLTTATVTARPSPVASPASAPAVSATVAASRVAKERAQAKLDGVLSSVEENGNVLDTETLKALGKAQAELAEAAADLKVQETLYQRDSAQDGERQRWNAVDTHMRDNFPDSLNHADEIGLHIQSDPLLQEAVGALVASGKEIQASVLAWKSYERSVLDGSAAVVMTNAKEKEADLAAKEQVRQELLTQARKDAGVVQGSAGGQGIHESTGVGAPSQGELDAVMARMRLEGDAPGSPAAMKFRHMIIGRHLDPTIFGPR